MTELQTSNDDDGISRIGKLRSRLRAWSSGADRLTRESRIVKLYRCGFERSTIGFVRVSRLEEDVGLEGNGRRWSGRPTSCRDGDDVETVSHGGS